MNQNLPYLRPDRVEKLEAALAERILVLDGAMGTMLQRHELDEAGYRGERFAHGCDAGHAHEHAGENANAGGCERDLKGDNDLLSLTHPEIIHDIHVAYLDASADFVETNTFNSTSISQADYALRDRGAGSDQPHRIAVAGRQQPRFSQRRFR